MGPARFGGRRVEAWSCGLLLGFLGFCVGLEEDCVLGIVGQLVSLPCVLPQLVTAVNVSVVWRRGEEVVLRSAWTDGGDVEEWSVNRATTPGDAALTGNVSLQLPVAEASERRLNYSLLVTSGGNQSGAELCAVCLRTAARFSPPVLRRAEAGPGGETAFWCHSSGGFPKPAVYWLLNDTEDPPGGSVRTQAAALPHSLLYNVSSRLTLHAAGGASVSCVVENAVLNENLTSTSGGVRAWGTPVVPSRASEAMWIFSTALCAVVGVLVAVGVVYQIHLDRLSRRRRRESLKEPQNRGYKRRNPREEEEEEEEEEEAMTLERKETDV